MITAKQEAIELRNKFRIFIGEVLDSDGEPKNKYLINRKVAKRVALLHIEELLKYPLGVVPSETWLEEVKKELEKLDVVTK